jgi:hypothetical protein
MVVLPLAGVHGAASQTYDDWQMLNSNWTLVLARAAGCALKRGFLRDSSLQNRPFAIYAEIIQVSPHAESYLLWIQNLSGIVGWTMLRAATALDTGVCLQGDNLSYIPAGDQPKILITI